MRAYWMNRGMTATLVGLFVSGCALPQTVGSQVQVLSGYNTVKEGVFAKGDASSLRAYSEREYLTRALPNVEDFDGYAGHVITYMGDKGPLGGCMDPATARLDVSLFNVLKNGEKAARLAPNGKLSEFLLTNQSSLKGGILVFFKSEVSATTSVQVLVSDVAHQSALPVLDPAKVAALKETPLPAGACDRRVVAIAVLTETISKVYRDVGRNASTQGFNISVGATWHNSTSEFARELRVYIETRPL